MSTLSKEESFRLLERCKFDERGYHIIPPGTSPTEAYHILHLFECTFPEVIWDREHKKINQTTEFAVGTLPDEHVRSVKNYQF
jgi:hypothetical protein